MHTLEDFRRMLERRDPTQLGRDVDDAVRWARLMIESAPRLTPALRTEVAEHFQRCMSIAAREARFAGPALVVSAALRESESRVKTARAFGKRSAEDAMRGAGFEPADYELNADDINALVRVEVQRLLFASGDENDWYDLFE